MRSVKNYYGGAGLSASYKVQKMSIQFRLDDVVWLDSEQVHPRPWNPNEMTEETYNQFSQKVMEEGFKEPICVCPVEAGETDAAWAHEGPHYWIWAGSHRFRLLVAEGEPKVPVLIYSGPDWNTEQQKIKTVRDNLVHGDLNPLKFTELVKSLDPSFDVDPRIFGFEDETEMHKFLIKEKTKQEKSFLDGYIESANKQKNAVDSLSDIVSSIFSQTAATIDQSYLIFAYKGQTHCVVLCDPPTFVEVQNMVNHLTQTGGDINEFMLKAIPAEIARAES